MHTNPIQIQHKSNTNPIIIGKQLRDFQGRISSQPWDELSIPPVPEFPLPDLEAGTNVEIQPQTPQLNPVNNQQYAPSLLKLNCTMHRINPLPPTLIADTNNNSSNKSNTIVDSYDSYTKEIESTCKYNHLISLCLREINYGRGKSFSAFETQQTIWNAVIEYFLINNRIPKVPSGKLLINDVLPREFQIVHDAAWCVIRDNSARNRGCFINTDGYTFHKCGMYFALYTYFGN